MPDMPHSRPPAERMQPAADRGKPAPSGGAQLMAVLRGERGAWIRFRRAAFDALEVGQTSRASRIIDTCIVTLILLNTAAFVAETVPSIEARWHGAFRIFETVSVGIFTIEYIVRLWASVEIAYLKRLPAWRARLTAARRPYMIIDLLSILPYYVSVFAPLDLRMLRVLRLVRFFKLSRYSPAMHTLLRVLSNEHKSLSAAGLLLVAAVLISATGMYHIEGRVQPDRFGTVPDAAYWAITTLTTVGYGDVVPVTPLGRVWAAMTMVVGLCVLALPVAIIATGFAQEVGRRDFVVTWSLMSRIPLLAELEAADASEVMAILHAHTVPPRTEVLKPDHAGEAMFFIASGHVQLRTEQGTVDYETGDFFGATAMIFGETPRGAYSTQTRTRLLKLYREDFQRLERINPAIGAHIRAVAATRVRQTQQT